MNDVMALLIRCTYMEFEMSACINVLKCPNRGMTWLVVVRCLSIGGKRGWSRVFFANRLSMHKGAVRRYAPPLSAAWLLPPSTYHPRGSTFMMWHATVGKLSRRSTSAFAMKAWLHHDAGQCLSLGVTPSGVNGGGGYCSDCIGHNTSTYKPLKSYCQILPRST